MRFLLPVGVLVGIWMIVSALSQSPLFPSPLDVSYELFLILKDPQALQHILVSLFRTCLGLFVAAALALLFGIPLGLRSQSLPYVTPLIAGLQSCPTIVWISLLMVWVGMGSVVPVVALVIVAFPALFLNVAGGSAAIDPSLLKMAAVYRVPRLRILHGIVIPGLLGHLAAGLSFASGLSWKVVSTAEFIASTSGVGAQIYNSYRLLNINRLFAWALLLVLIGYAVEIKVVQPLTRTSGRRGGD